MNRLPLFPTLLVLVAVPVMIGLGLWQLERRDWKEALLVRLEANSDASVIVLPASLDDPNGRLAFRRARVTCSEVRPSRPGAARAVNGRSGYRQQLWCRPAAGEPVLVALGVAQRPDVRAPVAPGASFTGPLVPRDGDPPDDPNFLLVAETPVPPLLAEAPPSPDTIANNHLGYAIQWFGFAATLALIYAVYVRHWLKSRP